MQYFCTNYKLSLSVNYYSTMGVPKLFCVLYSVTCVWKKTKGRFSMHCNVNLSNMLAEEYSECFSFLRTVLSL